MNSRIPSILGMAPRSIGINNFRSQIKHLLFLCLLQFSCSVLANPSNEEQIRQLEVRLLHLHQTQQSIFQQFQMVQELRRHDLKQEEDTTSLPQSGAYSQMEANPMTSEFLPGINIEGSPPSYEAMTKKRQERQKRIQHYSSELDRLHAQYQELEKEKKMLMEQISNLTKDQREELIEQ